MKSALNFASLRKYAVFFSLTVLCACTLSFTSVAPAHAGILASDPAHRNRLGYAVGAHTDTGKYELWLGVQSMKIDGMPSFCIEMEKSSTSADTPILNVATLTAPTVNPGAGLRVTTAQMAYILDRYQNTADRTVMAALSYLVHGNFEQPTRGSHTAAQKNVNWMLKLVQNDAQAAIIDRRARSLVSEAVSSGVRGYKKGVVSGAGMRSGMLSDIGVVNKNGEYTGGIAMTVTLHGPAVFSDSGKNVWTGISQRIPLSFAWKATGNGTVHATLAYKTVRSTLSLVETGRSTQKVITYGLRPASDIVETKIETPTWEVIFDFQPAGVSQAALITDDGTFTDTFEAAADPGYAQGKWLILNEQAAKHYGVRPGTVPVTYTVTAYHTGDLPAQETGSVPAGAQIIGTRKITAPGPGKLTARFTGAKPGFATVVWKVVKSEQGALGELIHADRSDNYGIPEETVSSRHHAEIDSALQIRETKSGTYLTDDLFVTGFPQNHQSFAGDRRFEQDGQYILQELLFFPEGLDVREENRARAEKIGQPLQIPAKNGYYPALGSTEYLIRRDSGGKIRAGTYVFVTSFPGDSRVKPFASKVTDVKEQYRISSKPELHTILTHGKGKTVPAKGVQTLTDLVCHTNLRAGEAYRIEGILMDRETEKPLTENGQEIRARKDFTAAGAAGCVEVEFSLHTNVFAGKTAVAFEKLFHGGKETAAHEDIRNENQSVKFSFLPRLETVASDSADGDKTLPATKNAEITDRVCERNSALIPGETYEIHTDAVVAENGGEKPKSVLPSVIRTVFTPETADGCAYIPIRFDASGLAGRKVVVFEDLYLHGKLLAAHRDINDRQQTVSFFLPPENPGPREPHPPARQKKLAQTGIFIGGISAFCGAAVSGGMCMRFPRRKKR